MRKDHRNKSSEANGYTIAQMGDKAVGWSAAIQLLGSVDFMNKRGEVLVVLYVIMDILKVGESKYGT